MGHYTCTSRGYASGWFNGEVAQYSDGLHLGVSCVTAPVVGVDANSGCISGSERVNLSSSGSWTDVNITVHLNCAGTTSTGWNFTVGCP